MLDRNSVRSVLFLVSTNPRFKDIRTILDEMTEKLCEVAIQWWSHLKLTGELKNTPFVATGGYTGPGVVMSRLVGDYLEQRRLPRDYIITREAKTAEIEDQITEFIRFLLENRNIKFIILAAPPECYKATQEFLIFCLRESGLSEIGVGFMIGLGSIARI